MKALVVVSLLFNNLLFAGHETGGGHPEAVRFKLLALRTVKAAMECKVPEALLKPFKFSDLMKVIRETELRMSQEPLTLDGGVVYAMPEKHPETGALRIAVFEPEWKKYPGKSKKIEVEWEIWNLHEYLRVLGLGKEDNTYDLATEIVHLAKDCLEKTSPVRFSTIEFYDEIRSSLVLVNSKPKSIDIGDKDRTQVLLCKNDFPEIAAKAVQEINRLYLDWHRNRKQQMIREIRTELKGFDVLDVETQPTFHDHVGYFAPGFYENQRWYKAQCAGGIQERELRLRAYVAEPLTNLQSSVEEFYASEVNIGDWNLANYTSYSTDTPFNWAKKQVDAHAKAERESLIACYKWLDDVKRIYGSNYRFAKCLLQNSHYKDWMGPSTKVGQTIRFSRSGIVYWSAD